MIISIAGSAAPLAAAVDTSIAQGFSAPEIRDYFEQLASVPAITVRKNSTLSCCAWDLSSM